MNNFELDDFNQEKLKGHREHALTLLEGDNDRYVLVCDDCKKTLQEIQYCEVFSRVVGYLRPVKQWNKGKQSEFEMRKEYKLE